MGRNGCRVDGRRVDRCRMGIVCRSSINWTRTPFSTTTRIRGIPYPLCYMRFFLSVGMGWIVLAFINCFVLIGFPLLHCVHIINTFTLTNTIDISCSRASYQYIKLQWYAAMFVLFTIIIGDGIQTVWTRACHLRLHNVRVM